MRRAAGRAAETIGRTLCGVLAAAAVCFGTGATAARAQGASAASVRPVCSAAPELLRLPHRLPRFARRLADGGPVRIVALGSSSTFGLGASSPATTYPARLEAELRRRHPEATITVVNRGVNGNETRDEMLRFQRDVLDERPDLVIWQLGTNSLLVGRDPGSVMRDVEVGVDRLKAAGVDVVLMNPQYSQRVLARPDWPKMLAGIADTARGRDVDVFDRFAIMKAWHDVRGLPFEAFVTADGLHMNDWSYGCTAELLAGALIDGAKISSTRR